MQNLIKWLVEHLGLDAVEAIVIPIEIDKLQHEDRPAIVRAFTVPEPVVAAMCHKTGSDLAAQNELRDKAANAFADFVLGFAPQPE